MNFIDFFEFYFIFFVNVQGRDATPYLERNRVGRDAIDSAAALTDMGKYLFRERRLPVYDIAVAITKYVNLLHFFLFNSLIHRIHSYFFILSKLWIIDFITIFFYMQNEEKCENLFFFFL